MLGNFKDIDYKKLLYEGLRNYFSINNSGEVSKSYKFLSAFVAIFTEPFESYKKSREISALIAQCKWQVGQMTNVLNYLYDKEFNRIFITQSTFTIVADPMFEYAPINFDSDFGSAPIIEERQFGDRFNDTLTIINIPSGIPLAEITATIEKVKITGISYQITIF